MASNLDRWMKYAKARLDAAVRRGNDQLDRKEAEREAELADRPWLQSQGDTPTLDEVRARIEHMDRGAGAPDADQGRAASEDGTPTSGPPKADGPSAPPAAHAGPADAHGGATDDAPAREPGTDRDPDPAGTAPTTGSPGAPAPAPELVDPATRAADAELASARLEIEANQREAAARLEAMRRELELDDPPPAGG